MDKLDWKTIELPPGALSSIPNDSCGFMSFEEVDAPIKRRKIDKIQARKIVDAPQIELPEWPELNPWILKGLKDLGFLTPTPIQRECLEPAILHKKSIFGAAETGSGKTLAFGIPILEHICQLTLMPKTVALIITPTRELAIQIENHLKKVIKPFSYSNETNRVNIVSFVGGKNKDKQIRQISQNPQIIIGTPGRLWELLENQDISKEQMKDCKYLVLDEADRLLEKGKFEQVEHILEYLSQHKLQKFVFSATLDGIDERLQLKKFFSVNLTSKSKTASTLQEYKLECLMEEKDSVLYHLLIQNKGRTLVFVNAVSTVLRLVPILKLLGLEVFAMHANMQQKQRLKSMESFSASDGIMVSTDVSSRGIDVIDIKHVIHYHAPREAEIYVHRSGRTARASKTGLSICLVTPEEAKKYNEIQKKLVKNKVQDFPFDSKNLRLLQERFHVANQIHLIENRAKKQAKESAWIKALDMEPEQQKKEDTKELRNLLKKLLK